MITIVSGTNRLNSRTELIAKAYLANLINRNVPQVQLFSLSQLPHEVLNYEMYQNDGQSQAVSSIQNQFFIESNVWIIITPEYNGGIPGIFKLMIDAFSIREYDKTFRNKKICLVGVSDGRSGNLRGLDYLTNVFHYLKADVFPLKLPISTIEKLIVKDELTDKDTLSAIDSQISHFLNYCSQ